MITKNEKIWAYRNELTWHCRKLPVGLLVVKRASSMREALSSIPGLVKLAKCHQRSATVAIFFGAVSLVQALSCGDVPRHLLHTST